MNDITTMLKRAIEIENSAAAVLEEASRGIDENKVDVFNDLPSEFFCWDWEAGAIAMYVAMTEGRNDAE